MTEQNGGSGPAAAAAAIAAAAAPARRATRERAWIVAAALVAVAGGIAYGAWRRFARPVDPRYAQVIDLLAHDPSALPAKDFRGCVDLSRRFHGLTPRDEMFVARRPDGSFLAMFPTLYGNGATLAALLYASRPLAEADTYVKQLAMGQAQRVVDVGSYTVYVENRVDEHWYHVSYGMR